MMARIADILDEATDYAGRRWDVREARSTAHGFDILLGWPSDVVRGQGSQGPAIIVTAELAKYLLETRLKDVCLPIGTTSVKRYRREVGARWSWDDWWRERTADLRSMTLEQFCRRHGCSMGAASQRRAELRADDAAK